VNITTGKVLLAGAGAYLLWQLYKLRSVGNLIFFPGPIHSFNFVGTAPVMTVNVSVQNTSGIGVTIDSLGGNLFSNGTLVGNVYTDRLINVPPNSRQYVKLSAQFMLIGLVNDLIYSFQAGHFEQNLQFQGYANVSGVQVPIDQNFKIGG